MTGASVLDLIGAERLDRLAGLDARLRIGATVLFALMVVSLTSIGAAVMALAFALAAALLGGISATRLTRLLPLELLMLVLLLTLPFTVPGTVLLSVGPLTASVEGLVLAGMILLKANAVALAMLGLIGALGPGSVAHALASLGVPDKLCHLLLLTLRQVELIEDEYRRMRLAMRARAFVAHSERHTWRTLGWLVGMLLVRSLARARRVSDAMRCRGFDGRFRMLAEHRWRRRDSLAALVLISALALLLLLDHIESGALT